MERINPKFKFVNVVGCGFAGIETAIFLARHGVKVHVFNIVFEKKSPTQNNEDFEDTLDREEFQKFNSLLEDELSFLESPFARKFKEEKERNKILTEEELFEYGKEFIKYYPNIELFDAKIHSINPKEITVLATGNHTEKTMIEFLMAKFGSGRCFEKLPTFPILDNLEEGLLIRNKLKDEYLLPLSREEYICFINSVVDQINEEKSKNNDDFIKPSVEYLVDKGLDYLKDYAMKPIVCDGIETKPYATLRLKKLENGYEIQNFCSNLSKNQQKDIFCSLKCFENAIIKKRSTIVEGCFINSQFVINEFLQANDDENLFFAGSILGLDGWRQCCASGLIAGLSVLKKTLSKQFIKFPIKTAIGKIIESMTNMGEYKTLLVKALLQNKIKEYKENTFEQLSENSILRLTKFKEEYKNGKYV